MTVNNVSDTQYLSPSIYSVYVCVCAYAWHSTEKGRGNAPAEFL